MKKIFIVVAGLLTAFSCTKMTPLQTEGVANVSINFVSPSVVQTKASPSVDNWNGYEYIGDSLSSFVKVLYTNTYTSNHIVNDSHYTPVFTLSDNAVLKSWTGFLKFDLPDVGKSLTFNPTMKLVNVKTDGSQPNFKEASGTFTLTNTGNGIVVTNTKSSADHNAIFVEVVDQISTSEGLEVSLKINVTLDLDSWLIVGLKTPSHVDLSMFSIYGFSKLSTGNVNHEISFPITTDRYYAYWGQLDSVGTFRISGSKDLLGLKYSWLITESSEIGNAYVLERGKWYGVIPSREGRSGTDDQGTVGGSSEMWNIETDGIVSGGKIG